MFHVELYNSKLLKALLQKGFLIFAVVFFFNYCGTARHSVEINDYALLPNGKQVLGKNEGLTAFIFENNPRKIPFVQFVVDKYNLGRYVDVSYWVTVEGYRFKVYVYDTDELNKYFDMGQFMVTKTVTDANIVGSTEKFIGLSVVSEANEDCLDENSLYHNIAINYLKNLKQEFNNL